jgi:DNA-binding XRE family transcriptional regulator
MIHDQRLLGVRDGRRWKIDPATLADYVEARSGGLATPAPKEAKRLGGARSKNGPAVGADGDSAFGVLEFSVPLIRVRFGQRVRSLRKLKGWSQVETAEAPGIDRSYLSEIESGKKDPSLTILQTFAGGFRMSISELMRGF